jgi:competence protein ComEA
MHAHSGMRHGRRHRKPPPAAPIDLNAADATQLQDLPGVGPSLAERIVAFRDVNGPFRSTDELLNVAGMTDRRLDAISPYVVAR